MERIIERLKSKETMEEVECEEITDQELKCLLKALRKNKDVRSLKINSSYELTLKSWFMLAEFLRDNKAD
jgi:hypothetical protein